VRRGGAARRSLGGTRGGGRHRVLRSARRPGRACAQRAARRAGVGARRPRVRVGRAPPTRVAVRGGGPPVRVDAAGPRRPGARDAALQREARENFHRYALHHPFSFLRMLGGKAARMWVTPNRGPHRRLTAWRLAVHLLLVGLALVGTLVAAGVVRRPGPGALL